MGALLGRNEDRLAMRDGQRGCRPTSPAREGGRRGRAGMAARGRAAQAGPLDIEGYDRQGGGVEKRRGARTLGGPSL